MPFDRDGFYREVGARMRRERKAHGLTQKQLADVLEMPRSTYANIERGGQRAPTDVVWRVAVALGLPVEELMPRPLGGPDLDLGDTRGSPEMPEVKRKGSASATNTADPIPDQEGTG